MTRNQISKILRVALVATIIIFICETVFSIPVILDWFKQLVINSGEWVWVVIWTIMFLQVTILNIPGYVILQACTAIGLETISVKYIACVVSAGMIGVFLAYWLGRKFGIKAVKWCAGSDEDYNKWSDFINRKGKIFYFLTVLFPFFPDDLLCLVCGSVKMNFGFFTVANFIGRVVGLITISDVEGLLLSEEEVEVSPFPFIEGVGFISLGLHSVCKA